MVGSEYSQLVHSGLEIVTHSLEARMADVKAATLVLLVPLGNYAGFCEYSPFLIVSLAVSKLVCPLRYFLKQADHDLRWC